MAHRVLLRAIFLVLAGLSFTFLYPHTIGLPRYMDGGLNDMTDHLVVTIIIGLPIFIVGFIAAICFVRLRSFPEEVSSIPLVVFVCFGVVLGTLTFHWATSPSAGGKAQLAGLTAVFGPALLYLSIVGVGAGFRASSN